MNPEHVPLAQLIVVLVVVLHCIPDIQARVVPFSVGYDIPAALKRTIPV
jgi:hypothetical protein